MAVSVGACSTSSEIDPRVQDMIDTLRSNGDCVSLQFQFDRYADLGDADVMTVIDKALRSAGCYG